MAPPMYSREYGGYAMFLPRATGYNYPPPDSRMYYSKGRNSTPPTSYLILQVDESQRINQQQLNVLQWGWAINSKHMIFDFLPHASIADVVMDGA